MDEKVNKPSIRFAGFTDAWKQRKFSDLADTRRGLTYNPANIEKKGHRVLRSSNITEDTFVLRDDDVFVTTSAINIPYAKNGDILITAANGSSRLVGKHAIICGIDEEPTVHGGFMLLASASSPSFLNASMSSAWYRNFVSLFVAGGNGAIGNLNKNDLDSQDVMVPSKEEQFKIGDLFQSLDHLIILHQRKYDKLVNIKKSMLEKMFPQHGTDVPEIHFAEFTDAWQRRKVGNVTEEIIQYVTFQSGFPLLTSSRSGLMFQNEYRDNTSTNNQDTLFSVVPMGACTYRHMSDDDIFHFNINELVENGLVSREYPVFVSSIGNNLSTVILYLNSSPKFKAFCREQKMGGTRTRLYYKNLCTFELLLPTEREQIKIAYFFKSLDTLLTLYQYKLTKLQNIKKSCLEKMFV